jgi:asparagine synthase (glutamine-hydrolysing)
MCGIAGVTDPGGDKAPHRNRRVAEAMCEALVHRGPDDVGVWAAPHGAVALSHRRLSIIDLSPLGHNPMSWDGGRLWITYNGEIYNFRELRKELEALGYHFRSQTDTEVVLAAYDRWGVEAVQRFAGMFAFALWDEPQQRLWLVRDRLGKKPLYYAESNGALRFASELKALLVDDSLSRDLDIDALGLYLRFGYIPSPYSIYRAVRKLPPAHYLISERGRISIRRYWDPVEHLRPRLSMSADEAETELDRRLSVAVKQRLIADVPLGGFLSGGVDSSLVVAMMKEQSESRVRTFTIRFTNPAYNEADHAGAVAKYLGTEHHEETCDERQMLDVVDRLADMFDEPFADSSAVPTYMVSKIARHYATVALSGDGGDELFFGYPRYQYYSYAARVLALPRPLRRAAALGADRLPTRRLKRIAAVLRSDEDDYGGFVCWWSPREIVDLTGREPLAGPLYADALARIGDLERDCRCGLLDLVSYLPEDILTKVDRASMAVSLEVRAPLLDHRVVEFALGLPPSMKRRGATSKWILRQLLYKRVPRELIDRPKMGFGVPLRDWFRGPLRDRMDDFLAGPELEDLAIDPRPVRNLWRAFLAGASHRTDLIWQMFMLVAWSRRFRALPTAAMAR